MVGPFDEQGEYDEKQEQIRDMLAFHSSSRLDGNLLPERKMNSGLMSPSLMGKTLEYP